MSLFNEVESCADPNAQELDLVEVYSIFYLLFFLSIYTILQKLS